MTRPRLGALRLWTSVRSTRLPPLGSGGRWVTANADSVAVWLDATAGDLETPSVLLAQIPAARALPWATAVVVLGLGARSGTIWRRLLGERPVPVSRASRCMALLALGYTDIGADSPRTSTRKEDLVWGWRPPDGYPPFANE